MDSEAIELKRIIDIERNRHGIGDDGKLKLVRPLTARCNNAEWRRVENELRAIPRVELKKP